MRGVELFALSYEGLVSLTSWSRVNSLESRKVHGARLPASDDGTLEFQSTSRA
jgi:hypothetical protein